MTRFAIDTISIQDDGMASPVTIRGMSSAGHRLGRGTSAPNSGHAYDEARFVMTSDDEFTADGVLALESLLDIISPVVGLCVAEDDPEFGLRLFGESLSRCGTSGRGASGTHAQITAALAHLFVTQITANPNDYATLSLQGVNISDDGSNDPSVTVYNASLPGTYVIDEAFKFATLQIGGVTIDEEDVTGVTINTGVNFDLIRNPVTGYVVNLQIRKAQPTWRINLAAGNALDSSVIPYAGKACTHANTILGLAALDPATGGAKALTGTDHIKVTSAGKAFIEDHLSGGGAADAGSTIVIETNESSGVPLIVTTGVALA